MTASLLLVHSAAYWVAFALFVAAAGVLWAAPGRTALASRLLVGALASQALAAVARWVVTAHPPIFGTYENTIAASIAVGIALVVHLRGSRPVDALYARLTALWPPLFLAFGLFFPRVPYPLTISERNLLVDIHVALAWGAFAVLLSGAMRAAALLIERESDLEAERLERIVRTTGVGFALFTCMLAIGAVYSYVLFADFWRWEIVGTSSAVAWIGYGGAMHAHLMYGWRDRRLAWVIVGLLPVLLFVFWAWSIYAGTYHHFDLNALIAR